MSDQLNLLDWQPVTKFRKRGPETSKAAARRAQAGCSKQCNAILQALSRAPHGLTRGEICDLTGILNQSACARLSELEAGGFAEVRGTREGPFGDQVKVYIATERGQERARVLREMGTP
jgi:predicted ArsR family transcriptional regulator